MEEFALPFDAVIEQISRENAASFDILRAGLPIPQIERNIARHNNYFPNTCPPIINFCISLVPS